MVTGIGGVFIKANDPKKLAAWYEEHLGVPFGGQSYVGFKWENPHSSEHPGTTAFSFFADNSGYFNPSEKKAMINFRVKELDALLERLKAAGAWVDEKTDSAEYGKFGWCMDPEGNKIELWEPVDGIF